MDPVKMVNDQMDDTGYEYPGHTDPEEHIPA